MILLQSDWLEILFLIDEGGECPPVYSMMTEGGIIFFWLCYMLGAVPFSVIIGKLFFKTDVRQHGSGNPGATNMLRTLGWKAGLVVLLFDMAKGAVPVILASTLFDKVLGGPFMSDVDVNKAMSIAGLAAILGHIYSPFLKFKGGKGVATMVGVILALDPALGGAAIGIFILVVSLTQYVSLASICAATGFFLLSLIFRQDFPAQTIFAFIITALIIYKHKANIDRLRRGEENKLRLKKTPSTQA